MNILEATMALQDDQVITILAAVAGSWSAMGTLGWWLSGQFRRVEEKASKALAVHEKLDNDRHEQNLINFGRVYVALARKGFPIVLDNDKLLDPPT